MAVHQEGGNSAPRPLLLLKQDTWTGTSCKMTLRNKVEGGGFGLRMIEVEGSLWLRSETEVEEMKRLREDVVKFF